MFCVFHKNHAVTSIHHEAGKAINQAVVQTSPGQKMTNDRKRLRWNKMKSKGYWLAKITIPHRAHLIRN